MYTNILAPRPPTLGAASHRSGILPRQIPALPLAFVPASQIKHKAWLLHNECQTRHECNKSGCGFGQFRPQVAQLL